MPDELSWDDADEIAEILRERFPDQDPSIVSELEIERWALEIPTLVTTKEPDERIPRQIEAIREAWRRDWAA